MREVVERLSINTHHACFSVHHLAFALSALSPRAASQSSRSLSASPPGPIRRFAHFLIDDGSPRESSRFETMLLRRSSPVVERGSFITEAREFNQGLFFSFRISEPVGKFITVAA